ncbi:unnamed protein product [Meloidogyne enterolobii]|uniref:Uncharacterized protein n=1 Tax=Meloidogyne enterolobii TaxID=390850 RepID=A0ACB0ZGN1_MELEN
MSSVDKAKEVAEAVANAEDLEDEAKDTITALSVSLENLATVAETAREFGEPQQNVVRDVVTGATNAITTTILAIEARAAARNVINEASIQAAIDDENAEREVNQMIEGNAHVDPVGNVAVEDGEEEVQANERNDDEDGEATDISETAGTSTSNGASTSGSDASTTAASSRSNV